MARPDFHLLDLPPDPPSSGGEAVTVFYDCEFTDLAANADLLSIGFVAADCDAELYIEITDANLAIASLFVRKEVLPLFGQHNPEVLTRDTAAKRVEAWLDGLREGNRDRAIILVSDSDVDWPFLLELIGADGPRESNIVERIVQHMLGSGRQMASFNEEIERYRRQHGQQHHALVDARCLKSAYWESRFS